VEQEGFRRTSPNANTRLRGLTSADNTRNFFSSRIPWDSYNVDVSTSSSGANDSAEANPYINVKKVTTMTEEELQRIVDINHVWGE
jgi:hypothetical protein